MYCTEAEVPTAPTYQLEQFTYNKQDCMLVAEESDLCYGHRRPLDGRVYDDACDAGFKVYSSKTNRTVRFVFEREEIDPCEGELIARIYKIEPADARKFNISQDLCVHVLND